MFKPETDIQSFILSTNTFPKEESTSSALMYFILSEVSQKIMK